MVPRTARRHAANIFPLRLSGGVRAETPASAVGMPRRSRWACAEETEAMENEEWQQTVRALVEAKRCLASAWQILDGTDGAASGVEHALNAALASIDAI